MDPKLFSQLTHMEAKLIRDKAFKDAKDKNMNLLLDQVSISRSATNDALRKNGVVKGVVVSTKVENALQRSFERAQETGRYEDTTNLLNCHQASPKLALEFASDHKGKNIHLDFFDNNVSQGATPNLFLEINCKQGSVTVHDEVLLKEFMKKQFINANAKTYQEIYPDSSTFDNEVENAMHAYLEQLRSHGYEIEMPKAKPKLAMA